MSNTTSNTHERLVSDQEVEGSSDRSFGIVMAVVFAIVGVWPALFSGPIRWWALVIAGLFGGLALAVPQLLAPLNRLWFRFGLLLNKIVSPLVMGLMFYGLFTPYGVIMRLMGKDLLRLKLDASASSYWIERDPPGPAPDSIKNQF